MVRKVPRRVLKGVFGRDPSTYDRYRLDYPSRVFDVLTKRCGLGPETAAFEIGPGTGIATRALLAHGVRSVTLVERDPRMARFLASRLRRYSRRVVILPSSFEGSRLPSASFDLGLAASSFHWLPERRSLRKVARLLRPGGWWATWGNQHGDPSRPSPFHEAIQPLYHRLEGRSVPLREQQRLAVESRKKRLEALREVGAFDRVSLELIRWKVTLEADHLLALWGSFSDVATLSPGRKAWFLGELRSVIETEFQGRVTFPMLSPLYTARRVL